MTEWEMEMEILAGAGPAKHDGNPNDSRMRHIGLGYINILALPALMLVFLSYCDI
jgi:hypothetical protein